MREWALLLALLLVPWAGCLGSDDASTASTDGDEAPLSRTRAEVTRELGAISGIVTDTAVQPVAEAAVTIVELNRSVTVRADGSYDLSQVEPGTYTLKAVARGFIPAAEEAVVKAGAVRTVDFLLTPLVSELPFTQEFEVAGFIEAGYGLGANLTGDPFWIRDSTCDYNNAPECRGEFELEPPLDALVLEMVWTPTNPLAEKLYVMLRVSDNAQIVTGQFQFAATEGASPQVIRMDRAQLDETLAGFVERCEGGEDQFCGLNFRDEGWPLQTRVWPSWQCPSEQIGWCPVFQQSYTQYMTAFYHMPAPEGYTILSTA